MDSLLDHEPSIRLGAFAGVALLLFAWQSWRPLRRDGRDGRRLLRNLGLAVVDTAVLRLAFPLLAFGWALELETRDWGLFNRLDWPPALEVALAVLALDLLIYWQHRWLHAWPLLWRLHRVHHSDIRFDVSTGVRFHPLEVVLSMLIKLASVSLLGAAAWAVLIFELLLSCGALFTHTDIALPARLDRWLRYLVVTPSMHRIHHSTMRQETDSNFGFHLSIWDRLFVSYRDHPQRPEAEMPIGLTAFRSPREQTLWALLLQPWRDERAATESSDA